MLGKLSDQDLALLSAYLDGELKQSDHQRVVARLEHEADLRAALTTLRQLKGTLRSMPQPQPKRHFTLGPEHARLSLGQRLGLANSWGLASGRGQPFAGAGFRWRAADLRQSLHTGCCAFG